ncbi:hypothetical protein M9458_006204, partial [Cirrhinus mrigala]
RRPPWPRPFLGIKWPGILARSRLTSAALVPSTDPPWTHEDTRMHARGRDQSLEERRVRHFNSGGVPHHTPPDLAVLATLLSHTPTPTPIGSLVKGGDYRTG